jgi:AdoMet-dependent rRNA methyltransferase SPB1
VVGCGRDDFSTLDAILSLGTAEEARRPRLASRSEPPLSEASIYGRRRHFIVARKQSAIFFRRWSARRFRRGGGFGAATVRPRTRLSRRGLRAFTERDGQESQRKTPPGCVSPPFVAEPRPRLDAPAPFPRNRRRRRRLRRESADDAFVIPRGCGPATVSRRELPRARIIPRPFRSLASPRLPPPATAERHADTHPPPLFVVRVRSATDKFYYLAKEQGYRSRASFKLVQLNRKYDFFSGARACMDLCAAPGGWLQVAAKYMPMSSLIVGVDLAPIKPIRGCTTFVDDITTQSCRAQLKRCTPDGVQYDVVIHDGAPNVGGNFAAESYTQAALTLDSLRLATEFLKEGGWFVTKVFRSTEYHALLYSMQQLFQKVESTKPVASRGTSAEIYVVCQGFLAPRKVDARLLDPRHLFAEYEGPKQAVDVLSHAKRPRNRSGYEDGVSALYKECPAETFVLCDKPAELLGQYHAFLLDASVRVPGVPETKNAVFWFSFFL